MFLSPFIDISHLFGIHLILILENLCNHQMQKINSRLLNLNCTVYCDYLKRNNHVCTVVCIKRNPPNVSLTRKQ